MFRVQLPALWLDLFDKLLTLSIKLQHAYVFSCGAGKPAASAFTKHFHSVWGPILSAEPDVFHPYDLRRFAASAYLVCGVEV